MRGAAAALMAGALWASPVAAHGLGARQVDDGLATVVEFYYSDGSVMAYGEARAFSPAAPQVPFTNGRADQLGRFAFVPDQAGAWRVEGKDSEGHQVTATMHVVEGATSASRWRRPRTWLLFGSMALNLVLLLAWIGGRRRPPSAPLAQPSARAGPIR